MHIELPRKDLLRAAKSATAVAKPGDLRPVLRNILLTVDSNGLGVSATDLTTSMWLTVPAQAGVVNVNDEGRALLSAKNFYSVVNTLTDDSVELLLDDTTLYVKSGRAKFDIFCEDAADFPKITRFSNSSNYATIRAKHLHELVKRVSYAAHTERSHFNMHGVLVKIAESVVELAATNGQRLCVAKASLDDVSDLEESAIIQASCLPIISRVLGASDDSNADIQWTRRGLNVRGEYGEIALMGLRGGFPPYERGIPKNSKTLSVNRLELVRLLKQMTALKGAATTFVEIEISGEGLNFNSSVTAAGNTKVVSDSEWEHDQIKLIMNPEFLMDAASSMSGDTINLELENPLTPALVRETSGAGIESLAVFAVARR